ncbi:MAG: MFS transporter [Betaproteobacteria bacterium]|nr:MFS transporter [Betaproteobacteria bacterium]
MSTRYSATRLAAVMCGAEMLSMTGFAAYTTLLPVLQREWGLSNSEAGLIGGIYYAGFVAATPILTSLTDRMDPRRIYLASCLISFAGAAGFALFAEGLVTALPFQMLIGVGLGGTYMPGLKVLTDQLEGNTQSRAIGFYTAGFGIGSSSSIIICGAIGAGLGWKWAFAYGAAGPLIAAALVNALMPPGRTHAAHQRTALFDFRPVLRNRKTLPYIIGYTLHNYELFGQRSWMVTFLVFCASLRADGAALAGAATLAALINLLGPVGAMCLSGLMACGLGWLAGLPLAVVFVVMCAHYCLMLGDSAALTSGVIASAPPELRGATMAVYSFIGFTAAFLAPLVFGVVLDFAGGNQERAAWALAFMSIGIFGALSPLARWMYLRTPASR